MTLSVGIVVPSLNEEKNLADTVQSIFEANRDFNYKISILIVNDGSEDNTGEVAEKLAAKYENIRVVHNKIRRGLGTSFTMGMFLLNEDYYGYIPGDNQIQTAYIVSLFHELGRADLLLSYPSNMEVRHKHRRVISRLFTSIYNLVFGLKLHYYNGPAFFRMGYLKELDIPTKFFCYHAETVIRFIKYGYSYCEVPCQLTERQYGHSTALKWYNFIGILLGTLFVFLDIYLLRASLYKKQGQRIKLD